MSHQSESSEDSSIDDLPLDNFDEEDELQIVKMNSMPKTKNEQIYEAPIPINYTLKDNEPVVVVGKIIHKLPNEQSIVIAHTEPSNALDLGSLVCTEDRTVIGRISDTFGPVLKPFYSIRFNLKPTITCKKTEQHQKQQNQKQQNNPHQEQQIQKQNITEEELKQPNLTNQEEDEKKYQKLQEQQNQELQQEQVQVENVEAIDYSKSQQLDNEQDVYLTGNSEPILPEQKHNEGSNIESNVNESVELESTPLIATETKEIEYQDGLYNTLSVGQMIYAILSQSEVVYPEKIYVPGSDASNLNDEEINDAEQEFSDDEKEMEAKMKTKPNQPGEKRKKNQKGKKAKKAKRDPAIIPRSYPDSRVQENVNPYLTSHAQYVGNYVYSYPYQHVHNYFVSPHGITQHVGNINPYPSMQQPVLQYPILPPEQVNYYISAAYPQTQ